MKCRQNKKKEEEKEEEEEEEEKSMWIRKTQKRTTPNIKK